MKTKRHSFFIAIISAIYILAVAFFSGSLIYEKKAGAQRAQNRFNTITKDLSRISRTYTPKTDRFYDEVLASLGNISDIAGMQIKYGNELIFSYPKDINQLNSIKTSMVSTFTTTVFSESGIAVSVTASIYKLKPVTVFYKGRIAFIIILAATAAVAFYLILNMINGRFPTEKETETPSEDEIEYPDIESYNTLDQDDEEKASEEEEASEEAEAAPPEESGDAGEIPQAAEEEDVLDFLNKEKEATEEEPEETAREAESREETAEPENQQPKGLFCPETGFGWEQYMLTRLDSELVRCASTDRDMSLLTIKIASIDWTSECGKKICRIILDKAKFNDLVFNYKEDGVAAIFQNQNTDQALVSAEELYNEMNVALKECGIESQISIGISTRSLRLISGQRLANESEEALKHAMEDPDSPIIAFRVNPERYRDYLASESYQEQKPATPAPAQDATPKAESEDAVNTENPQAAPAANAIASDEAANSPETAESDSEPLLDNVDSDDIEIDEELKI